MTAQQHPQRLYACCSRWFGVTAARVVRSFQLPAMIVALFAAAACQEAHAQFGIQQRDIIAMYLFNGQDEATFKNQLESSCNLRVKRIFEVIGLDAEQKRKLDFAIRGDINRLYREMEFVRHQTKDLNLQDQADMQKAWQVMQPLYTKVTSTGIVGDDSLFERVLESTLTSEQQDDYRAYMSERQRAEVDGLTRLALAELEKSIPLLAEQRQQIISQALELDYPRKIQRGMESMVGFLRLSKLPDEEMQEILDAEQYAAFQKFKQQYLRLGGIGW